MVKESSDKAAVEFWFDFSSPYAYFAAHDIDRRVAKFGRSVIWRPFLLGAVFKLTGMTALATTPIRGDYARRDWARIAQILALPFQLPKSHPYPTQCVARAYYWLAEHRPEVASNFAWHALQEHFVHQRSLERPEAVVALAADFLANTEGLSAWLGSDEAKQTLRTMTEEAVAKGVFGSPFFIANGEPFWGWDRIPLLETWLERGAWP